MEITFIMYILMRASSSSLCFITSFAYKLLDFLGKLFGNLSHLGEIQKLVFISHFEVVSFSFDILL